MSYEPTNWKTGDVVTSAKLNKLENAVANGGALLVNVIIDNDTQTAMLDKTFAEIKAAFLNGVLILCFQTLEMETSLLLVGSIVNNPSDNYYEVQIKGITSDTVVGFTTNDETDYPQHRE